MLATLLPAAIAGGASLLGGFMNNDAANERADRNEALQREFAQNGISWKVADAKRAGIHPLAALGTNTTSFSNVVGGSPGTGVAAMGQDISRAMYATQDQATRDDMFSKTARELQLTNYTLRNDLLASQIAKLKASGNPPMPPGTLTEAPLDKDPGKRGRNVIQGSEVRGHPGYVQTNAVTDEYGETIGDWIYGPLKTYMDWAYHQSGAANQQQYRDNIADGKRRARERQVNRSRGNSGGGW